MSAPEPTEAEAEGLGLMLREMRHATATKQQLQVVFDPWIDGSGANVSFMHSATGYSTTVPGRLKATKRRARR